MTRARALKQVVRARAARTGERYTSARRHVLQELKLATRPKALPPSSSTAAPAISSTLSRGTVSDAKTREKTGQGLDHWFAVLDRFGAVAKGHTAAARHLFDDHKVPGWYAQGITVAYERARGVRAVNQRCDGDFEVSVSKIMGANVPTIISAFTGARRRKRWMATIDPQLAKALTKAVSEKAKGFVTRPDGHGRFRFKWDDTTVQLYLIPKNGKTSLVVQHTKLQNASAVDERRAIWKTALAALSVHLAAR